MPPIPLLRPPEVIKAFEKFGWQVARQKGSHIILTKHARGTLRSLIGKAGVTAEEFIEAAK
jgi:predicted RNA binding protein YcfA (HicA-like mRNA interferase family)